MELGRRIRSESVVSSALTVAYRWTASYMPARTRSSGAYGAVCLKSYGANSPSLKSIMFGKQRNVLFVIINLCLLKQIVSFAVANVDRKIIE